VSWTNREARSESGFTLVELLIVTVLLPMIVGSMSMAIIVALGIQSNITNAVGSSGDAQVVSSVFYGDVQEALAITTSASAAQCGAGAQLLGLEWGLSTPTPPTYSDVVSYVAVRNGSSYSLVRNFCASGFSSTPTGSTTVVNDISATQGAPAVTPSNFVVNLASGWVSAQGITGVAWTVTEPKSGYSYVLDSTPAVSSSSGSTG
jgi:hypothetical protein